MKKKELIVTLIIAFILIIAMCYTFLNPVNNNFEQPNTENPKEEDLNIEEIKEEDATIYSETEFNNKYKLSGYRKVDIPNKMPEFKWGVEVNEMSEMKDDINYNLEFHYLKDYGVKDVYVGAEIVDNKAYFIFNNEKLEIPVYNMKKIYILWNDFQSKDNYILYFLTNDGEMYIFKESSSAYILDYNLYDEEIKNEEQLNKKVKEQLNNLIENITKVNNKIKYEKLIIIDYGETFNFDCAGLGYDNKMYLLDTGKEITKNDFPYSQFSFHKGNNELIYLVDLDGNVIINPFINTNVEFKFSINDLIFSENNSIYKVIYDNEYKLQEIGKLKLLYVNKKEQKVAILLEDGKVMTGSYNDLQNIEF